MMIEIKMFMVSGHIYLSTIDSTAIERSAVSLVFIFKGNGDFTSSCRLLPATRLCSSATGV
jgi:hypothetical protein